MATPPEGADSVISPKPLSEYALLLLLILTNHCTDTSTLGNPYRDVLFNCSNSVEASKNNDNNHVDSPSGGEAHSSQLKRVP